MNERVRDLALLGAVAVVMVAGVGLSMTRPEVVMVETVRPVALFEERSVFCFAVPGEEDRVADATSHVIGAPFGVEEALIGTEPSDQPPETVRDDLVIRSADAGMPLRLVGHGARVAGASSTRFRGPVSGLGAARCADAAGTSWLFPAGSSERGFSEWITIFNPFPDEAVVRVDLFTEQGARSKANLADVAVPAGRSTTVRLNDFILQEPSLSAEVTALRGRVVAWKSLFVDAEETAPGVATTLGAPGGATDWYFPAGAVGPEARQFVSILNPTEDEALVSVSVVADTEVVLPPDLLEMPVPARSSITIDLADNVRPKDPGGTSVAVRSVNSVPIAVERTSHYDSEGFRGVSTEIGATQAARSWWVPPATVAPERDAVVVLNTTDEPVRVEVDLFGPGATGEVPKPVEIPPGGRIRIGLATEGPAIALVEASGAVVVERIAYSSAAGDVASVMGTPVLLGR